MQVRLLLCCGLLAGLLSACSTVEFKEAQPVNVSAKTAFPKELQGVYAEDGDTLIVKKDRYISISWNENEIILSEGAKDFYRLDNPEKGKIYLDKDGFVKGHTYKINGDTLFYSELEREEEILGGDKILKSAYGYHFFNLRSDDGFWTVVLIDKNKKGQLTGKMIDWKVEESLIPKELRFKEMIAKGRWKKLYSPIVPKT